MLSSIDGNTAWPQRRDAAKASGSPPTLNIVLRHYETSEEQASGTLPLSPTSIRNDERKQYNFITDTMERQGQSPQEKIPLSASG